MCWRCSVVSLRSLSLVLDEFYSNLTAVGVSAVTGEGMEELFQARRGVCWGFVRVFGLT